ncbi:MAG: replication initiator protein WhiP [Desulfurococcales archaeon]|nr:replication initiator protein WhiP [Desulfurococcales archaeon]
MDDDLEKTIETLLERRRREKERGGPRSRLVDAIMVLLLSKPMRSSEIAGLLGYETKYISSYLSYWKTRGYVEYNSGFWFLTPKGEEYAREVAERASDEKFDRLAALAQRILAEANVKKTINDKTPTPRPHHGRGSLSFIVSKKRKPDIKLQERARAAACFIESLRDELSEDELEVLTALLSHYSKWGSTYLYLDQLAELINADYKWVLSVVRMLQSKNIVYLYTDPRLGVRVGLSKPAKELLEECLRG